MISGNNGQSKPWRKKRQPFFIIPDSHIAAIDYFYSVNTATDILSLIPQRYPFIMVDRLLFCDENTARTGFRVAADNIFVSNGKFREPGLVENIAQTAAARAGHIAATQNKTPAIGYIGDVKNLDIACLPKIGDELETEIKIENQVFAVTIITGKVWCKNKLVAQCEMKIFINQSK